MNEFYTYEYYVEDTDEVFYIGKGKGDRAFSGRRNKFCEDMKSTHNWKVRIIKDNLTEEEAFAEEIRLIKHYRENTDYRITNRTDGGDGASGLIVSEEVKRKISESSKLKWQDEEFKKNQMYHRQHGVYKSKEFSMKISALTKGELNGNYNNRWNEKQKRHLSEKRKLLGLAKGINNPKATKIMCIETGEIFDYIGLAQKKYGVKHEGSFTVAFKNPIRTCAGLHWVKITDDNLDHWLSDENRRNHLIDVLKANQRLTLIICEETNQIFKTKKELQSHLQVGIKMTNKILKNNICFNGYHYKIVE